MFRYVFIYDELIIHYNLHNLNIKEEAKYIASIKDWSIIFGDKINIEKNNGDFIEGCCYVLSLVEFDKLKKYYKKTEIEVPAIINFGDFEYNKNLTLFYNKQIKLNDDINIKLINELLKYKDFSIKYKQKLMSILS